MEEEVDLVMQAAVVEELLLLDQILQEEMVVLEALEQHLLLQVRQ